MNAITAVPETESGTENSAKSTITPDAFADAVRDLLMERWPQAGRFADEVEQVTAHIVDAYLPRIRLARQRADKAETEMRHLVDRDRATHELLTQLKATISLFIDGQMRERLVAHQYNDQLMRIRQLVRDTEQEGSSMIALAEVSPILDTGVYVPQPAPPLVVAVRPDHRFRYGTFLGLDGENGRSWRYAFIGWSVVIRSMVPDSEVEPCFLVDGVVVPRSALLLRGLTLQVLA